MKLQFNATVAPIKPVKQHKRVLVHGTITEDNHVLVNDNKFKIADESMSVKGHTIYYVPNTSKSVYTKGAFGTHTKMISDVPLKYNHPVNTPFKPKLKVVGTFNKNNELIITKIKHGK